jgi:membrane-bound lytic murein transglycosylase D
LRELNSHVLRWTTPPDDPDFQLILPKGYANRFNEQISSLPESKRILYREHVVQRGETLSVIARKYGTSSAQLIEANNLGKNPLLKAGRSLVIPMSAATPPQPQLVASRTRQPSGRKPVSKSVSSARSLTYTVRAGDTLAKIATRYNTSVEKLKSWNHLTSTRLVVGKRLIIGIDKTDAAN